MKRNYDKNTILSHWNSKETESMYDKFLLNLEIDLISKFIDSGTKILDAGCGEGEGTLAYSRIPGTDIHAADFSDTRLSMAKKRLGEVNNISFHKVDFSEKFSFNTDFDYVISQRFLINITDISLQYNILLNLTKFLKPGGKLILLEGYSQGVEELNIVRKNFGLDAIPVQWHNLFFDNEKLISFLRENKLTLIAEDGFGEFFLLTRCLKPAITNDINWDNPFNKLSCNSELKMLLKLNQKFSRLKLWVFQK